MKQKMAGLTVGVLVMAVAVMGWAQTNLTVIRKSDSSIWTRTCDGTSNCSDWFPITGKFAVQPTLTWDPSIQKYILIGIGNNLISIWRTTFDANGTWDGAWTNITGTSGGSPSPVGIAGGALRPKTTTVNCPGDSLQDAVDAAQTGDVINVTGTCDENVVIGEEKQRLTLDGGNVATIDGDSNSRTLTVRGSKGIRIQNFTITGGAGGILMLQGSSGVINNNNIHDTGGEGVVIQESSSSRIVNNNIHNNPRDGITIHENSTARIGFYITSDSVPSPNTIQSNGGRGISVLRTSHAQIVSNNISDNASDGIGVFRLSHADIASNTINHNGTGAGGGHGINVGHNSAVQLGEDGLATFFDQPNTTTVLNENVGYGINCSWGGLFRGHLGNPSLISQINGGSGQVTNPLPGNCMNGLVTP
jgi:parallel beta-helix repeat protein